MIKKIQKVLRLGGISDRKWPQEGESYFITFTRAWSGALEKRSKWFQRCLFAQAFY